MSQPFEYSPEDLPTITRAALQAATERAIESCHYDLAPELADKARDLAAKAEYICGDWSSDAPVKGYGTCGCLVGTLRMRAGLKPYVDGDEDAPDSIGLGEYDLGIKFLDELGEAGVYGNGMWAPDTPLRVVDDAV